MSTDYRTFVVANPTASGGSAAREWTGIEQELRSNIREIEVAQTEGPGHATMLARDALRAGWEMIVAVGGDGTLNEVVNGLFQVPDPETCYAFDGSWIRSVNLDCTPVHASAVLGHVPLGSANDFCRSVGLTGSVSENVRRLRGRKTRAVDVGQIGFIDHEDRLATRYFINAAAAGVSGTVQHVSDHSWTLLQGVGRYLGAAVRVFVRWENVELEVRIDHEFERRARMLSLVVSNGQFFGVGMWGAPGAKLDDGLLDVIAVGDLSRFQALLHLRTIYRGDHLDLARVNRHRAREVVARVVRPRDVCLLDVDGEQLGRLPAIWNVHRRAVRLKV